MDSHFLLRLVVGFTYCCVIGLAYDPSPLQDFCVADLNSTVFVNGLTCKDPKLVEANDFFFSGFHLRGNTSNPVGHAATGLSFTEIPGLNTLGISIVRNDFVISGVNPPHTHPRASETILVLEGTIEVGFVTSNPDNRLFTKVLQKGDVFVFPMGLVHFNKNIGKGNATSMGIFNHHRGAAVNIPDTLFRSSPAIPSDLLAKSFQVDTNIIDNIFSALHSES